MRIVAVPVLTCLLLLGAWDRLHAQPGVPPQEPASPSGTPPGVLPPQPPVPGNPAVHEGPNVRVEATIRDHRPDGPVVTKVVSVVVADREEGRVRTVVMPKNAHAAPLHVDVRPFVQSNGRILVRLSLQYDLGPGPAEEPSDDTPGAPRRPPVVLAPPDRSSVNETVAVVLEDGKPMIVTQSADAITDRKVTVEVRATVLE